MKYIIDGEEFNAYKAAEYITDNLDDEVFDEMLDECYEPVVILGVDYDTSVALYRTDPTAYNCAKSNYYSNLAEDIICDLERMDEGETAKYYGVEVQAVEA